MNEVPDYPPSSLIDANMAGWKAAKYGVPFAQNPFKEGTQANFEWSKGWLSCNRS